MSEVFFHVLTIVFPIFFIVGLGALLNARKPIDIAAINHVNLNVFIPALIFHAFVGRGFVVEDYAWLALAAAICVFLWGLLSLIVSRAFSLNPRVAALTLMFPNTGNMGVPLIVFAFGEQALPAAVVLLVVNNVLHFSVGVRILRPGVKWWGILANPMIIAAVAGLGFNLSGWELSLPLARLLEMLANVSIPLMLLSLGLRLRMIEREHMKTSILLALVRPLVGLAAAGLVIWLVPLADPLLPKLILLYGVLPPAVLNYMLAERYNTEPDQVASIVFAGTLSAVIVVPLALVFLLS